MVIEPGIPDWARRAFLDLEANIAQANVPTPVYAAPTADLTAALAARYPNTMAYDTTLGSFVFSNGSAWV